MQLMQNQKAGMSRNNKAEPLGKIMLKAPLTLSRNCGLNSSEHLDSFRLFCWLCVGRMMEALSVCLPGWTREERPHFLASGEIMEGNIAQHLAWSTERLGGMVTDGKDHKKEEGIYFFFFLFVVDMVETMALPALEVSYWEKPWLAWDTAEPSSLEVFKDRLDKHLPSKI